MTRVIKFRAWNKAKKLWEYGIGMGMDGVLITNHNEDFELVQFIGLYDKNGKEVFEGDYLEYQNHEAGGHIHQVSKMEFENFGEFLGMFDSEWQEGNRYLNVEVVGNVYEKSELLT
ncbi:MAG: YopX family protein [Blastocatellales bacterium]